MVMDWRIRHHRRQAFNLPGHAHELTFSCYRGYKFLSSDRTCQWLAAAIEAARGKLEFDLWAYVFMPEHVHLIVRPRRPIYDIREILAKIKEPVGRQAIAYLREHAPTWMPRVAVKLGHRVEHRFWQAGGGYDRNVENAATLFKMIEYIHLNPVRRGLVAKESDWKWSSASKLQSILVPDPIDVGLLGAVVL
jgi:putative transposase